MFENDLIDFSGLDDLGKEKRYKTHFLVTYHNSEIVQNVILAHDEQVEHYAYITHDNDLYSEKSKAVLEGKRQAHTYEQVHCHIILVLKNDSCRTCKQVCGWFPKEQNTFSQYLKTGMENAYNYLTHSTEQSRAEHKAPYSVDKIVCDSLEFWRFGTDDKYKNYAYINIVCDIMRNVPTLTMIAKYGRDFLVNSARYKSVAEEYYWVLQNILDFNYKKKEYFSYFCEPHSNQVLKYVLNYLSLPVDFEFITSDFREWWSAEKYRVNYSPLEKRLDEVAL